MEQFQHAHGNNEKMKNKNVKLIVSVYLHIFHIYPKLGWNAAGAYSTTFIMTFSLSHFPNFFDLNEEIEEKWMARRQQRYGTEKMPRDKKFYRLSVKRILHSVREFDCYDQFE